VHVIVRTGEESEFAGEKDPLNKPRASAHFRHNLTMLEFDSSRHGMGDDAGSGKLGLGTLCAGRGLRCALFFLGKLRQ
jgi:hypothetical protein